MLGRSNITRWLAATFSHASLVFPQYTDRRLIFRRRKIDYLRKGTPRTIYRDYAADICRFLWWFDYLSAREIKPHYHSSQKWPNSLAYHEGVIDSRDFGAQHGVARFRHDAASDIGRQRPGCREMRAAIVYYTAARSNMILFMKRLSGHISRRSQFEARWRSDRAKFPEKAEYRCDDSPYCRCDYYCASPHGDYRHWFRRGHAITHAITSHVPPVYSKGFGHLRHAFPSSPLSRAEYIASVKIHATTALQSR